MSIGASSKAVLVFERNALNLPGRIDSMTDVEPKEFVLAGVVMKRLVSGEQTQGSFCLFENRSDGETKTPIHVHADDDETVYSSKDS
jgi:hypothetical protein